MSKDRNARRLLAVTAALVAFGSTPVAGGAMPAQASVAGHCKAVGKGTAWSWKGQKGRSYTVEGNRATACAVGIKWLLRLTNIQGVPKTPPGWQCVNAVAFPGQCSNKSGAIFEWNAKLK